MRRWGVMALVLAAGAAPAAVPGGNMRMLGGADAVWAPSPLGMQAATILKAGDGGGPLYVIHVRYRQGERSPAHIHPDPRVVTIMRGTIEVGSGATLARRTMRTGETFLIEAGMPHFGHARAGAAIMQEVGSGPTGTTILPSAP